MGRMGRLGGLGGLRGLETLVNLRSSFGDPSVIVKGRYMLRIGRFANLLIILTFVANSYFTIKKWFYPLKFLGLCNTS